METMEQEMDRQIIAGFDRQLEVLNSLIKQHEGWFRAGVPKLEGTLIVLREIRDSLLWQRLERGNHLEILKEG